MNAWTQKQLKELDQRMKEAKNALLKEKIRGYLINWSNNFKRLDRAINSSPADHATYDSETYAFYIRRTLDDCICFTSTHIDTELSLKMLLIEIEAQLTKWIQEYARSLGSDGSDLSQDIMTIIEQKHISSLVSYIKDIEKCIEEA